MISLVARRCATPLIRTQINRCGTREIAPEIPRAPLPSERIGKSRRNILTSVTRTKVKTGKSGQINSDTEATLCCWMLTPDPTPGPGRTQSDDGGPRSRGSVPRPRTVTPGTTAVGQRQQRTFLQAQQRQLLLPSSDPPRRQMSLSPLADWATSEQTAPRPRPDAAPPETPPTDTAPRGRPARVSA